MKINHVHIQTIDACNSKCIMCPNSYKTLSGKIISDEIFIKIIQETLPFVNKDTTYLLYLQNEPLLDDKLYCRAQFIKQVNKNSNIEIFTNGILLPEFGNKTKYFDKILVSMYGNTVDEYNRVTKSNITEEQFNDIIKAINMYNNVESNNKFSKDWKSDEDIKSSFTSRAGFLSNNYIINDEVNCSKNAYDGWLNFLVDGSVILCCMDYVKESVIGNIKNQTLQEIFNSAIYKAAIEKAAGRIESEENFICKKCEKNIGKN